MTRRPQESDPTNRVRPIQTAQVVACRNGDHYVLRRVSQRKWSRVALGDPVRHSGPPVFVKQFVSPRIEPYASVFQNEMLGFRIARLVLPEACGTLLESQPQQLMLVYQAESVTTPDELLRSNIDAFNAFWPMYRCRLVNLLQELRRNSDLAIRSEAESLLAGATARAEHGVVLFKGFEVRNIGATTDPGERSRLMFFDYGKPYISTINEAVARIVVSILMLRWGRPARMFALGPPTQLADEFLEDCPYALRPESLAAELAREARIRFGPHHATRPLIRYAESAAVQSLGRRYFGKIERWKDSRE